MKDSTGEAERWLRQAEHDLEFARVALRERFHAPTCFIAQPSAEKALKALLYRLGERVVLGHSLMDLLDRLEDPIPDVATLRESAGILDQYYVPTRYPNALPGGVPFEAFGKIGSYVAAMTRRWRTRGVSSGWRSGGFEAVDRQGLRQRSAQRVPHHPLDAELVFGGPEDEVGSHLVELESFRQAHPAPRPPSGPRHRSGRTTQVSHLQPPRGSRSAGRTQDSVTSLNSANDAR